MASEKRLIDANAMVTLMCRACNNECCEDPCEPGECFIYDALANAPTADAVEIPDKELLKAVKLLIKQYGHSKQSDYVHNPVAHAFYYTWKQLDEGRRED